MADVGKTVIEENASVVQRASTQSLDLSFNELLDMHGSGELNITPDYQRLRWSEGQRSRFVRMICSQALTSLVFRLRPSDRIAIGKRDR